MKMHFLLLTLCTLGAVSAFSQAKERERPNRFMISAGVFKPEINTELRIDDVVNRISTQVNAEDDLGLNREVDAYKLDAMFRMSRRISLTGSWYKLDRSSDVELSRDIEFMDTVHTLGTQVTSKLNTTFTSVSLRYSILYRKNVEAGLSLGARWVSADVAAVASSDGITVEHAFSGGAPAPLPGLFVSAHILPSLQLSYNFEYFTLAVKEISGQLQEHRVSLAFYPVRNVGAGVSWADTRYSVNNIPFQDGLQANFNTQLTGFTFFVAARF